MEFRLFPTPGEFLAYHRAFLEAHEVVAQHNLGNAAQNAGSPCGPQLLFGSYELDGRPLLLFGNTAPWPLCLNGETPVRPQALDAARELAKFLKSRQTPITGVSGPDPLCKAFLEAWGGRYRLRTSMDIMALRSLVPPRPVEGVVRRAREEDLPVIARWMIAFLQEALGETEAMETRLEKDREKISQGRVWVMEDPRGQLVSTAGISRQMVRGANISSVYTPPEFRGRGYCQNTVAAVCREILGSGMEYCALFVDRANPISNRVYRKIGFHPVEACSDYRLEA